MSTNCWPDKCRLWILDKHNLENKWSALPIPCFNPFHSDKCQSSSPRLPSSSSFHKSHKSLHHHHSRSCRNPWCKDWMWKNAKQPTLCVTKRGLKRTRNAVSFNNCWWRTHPPPPPPPHPAALPLFPFWQLGCSEQGMRIGRILILQFGADFNVTWQ